jgi:hypothetical protein
MTSTEQQAQGQAPEKEPLYTLQLTGKQIEILAIAFGIAAGVAFGDDEHASYGVMMLKLRGREARETMLAVGLHLSVASDAVSDNDWVIRANFDDLKELPPGADETGLEPPSPFPMARPEVC